MLLTQEQEMIRDAIRTFVREAIAPPVRRPLPQPRAHDEGAGAAPQEEASAHRELVGSAGPAARAPVGTRVRVCCVC